jgi:hypothetical protein
MPATAVAPVKTLCVATVEQLHPDGEIRCRRLHDEVVVAAHEAVTHAPPTAELDDAGEDLQEVRSVRLAAERESLVHRASRNVKDPTRLLDPVSTRHTMSVRSPTIDSEFVEKTSLIRHAFALQVGRGF